ncbi:cysteine synthase A [Eubacterium ruminantium]|uniref:cysteine synthase n=1 Tax=Eubacterium ruminantium TaxID=42322 RepID=A0A1T4KHV1_9FIRM|nr:cysteine synthase family protein [Eubacterium ruminantium]SCW32201.1 cysteine synthase A [Eubacterium ruminantium]SDM27474.1 cysteine synthase A [Eubacterium ruminantium]SJZ42012.1 cysteine synthase A [Eubacterium ruminantium]
MANINTSIAELVGKTPLLELTNYEKNHNLKAKILVKLEYFNPNQSVKDRIALAMIEDAEKKGLLKPGYTVVETTSGNTGIGLAAIAAAKGYKFRVYIQDNVSQERFQVIRAFGGEPIKLSTVPVIAEVLEETNGDFVAAIGALREKVLAKEENIFFVDQTANPANPGVHEATTGPEIWNDTDGNVDILVANVGTGGTVSGTGKFLKSKNPDIKVVAIQPGPNSIPSEANPEPEEITGVHPFEGVPAERVPSTMDLNVYDEKVEVETIEAFRAAREVAKSDGILIGTSSGAAIHAATRLAERPENEGKTIVAILPDTGLRYLSTNLFNEEYQG